MARKPGACAGVSVGALSLIDTCPQSALHSLDPERHLHRSAEAPPSSSDLAKRTRSTSHLILCRVLRLGWSAPTWFPLSSQTPVISQSAGICRRQGGQTVRSVLPP